MGGPGSGRWRGRGRETVEAYCFLDANRLSKTGYLRPGLSGLYHWTDGNEVASIKLDAEAGRLHISRALQRISRKWVVRDQEGGGAEDARRWKLIVFSMQIACRRRAIFGPACRVSTIGLTAT